MYFSTVCQLIIFLASAQSIQATFAKRYTNSTADLLHPHYANSTSDVTTTITYTNVIMKTTTDHTYTLTDTVYVTEYVTEPDSFFATYLGPNPVNADFGSQLPSSSDLDGNDAAAANSDSSSNDLENESSSTSSVPTNNDNNSSPTTVETSSSNSNSDSSEDGSESSSSGSESSSNEGSSSPSNAESSNTETLSPIKNSDYSSSSQTALPTTPVSISHKDGTTTTSTIYSAKTSPTSISSGSLITSQSTTSVGPLITSSLASSSVSITINSATLTTGITVTGVVSQSTTVTGTSTSSICVASNSTSNSTSNQGCGNVINAYSGDLFKVISTESPSSIFVRGECPAIIAEGVSNDRPYETNKFQANLFLDEQTDTIWTYPYGLFFDNTNNFGWGVSYVPKEDYVFDNSLGISTQGADVLITPVGVASLLFSASQFSSVSMKVNEITDMSVHVEIYGSDEESYIEFPTVLGQGFVTSIYHGNLVAYLKSTVGVQTLVQVTSEDLILPNGYTKYRATLYNDIQWLIYVSSDEITLDVSEGSIIADQSQDGLIIQVAVAPEDSDLESYYDSAAGIYPTTASVSGSVTNGKSATYGFTYTNAGSSVSGSGLVFALPHHISSLNDATAEKSTGISLDSTTKGTMYAYLTDEVFMDETLFNNVQFAPWSSQLEDTEVSWTSEQLSLIASVAAQEAQIDLASAVQYADTYGSGKMLDRYAYIVYVLSEVIEDEEATAAALDVLKQAYEIYTSNNQLYPLMYDTKFGGIATTANNNGNNGTDYGAGYYNDHHFHYGYFVHAAAIIAYVDAKNDSTTWVDANKDWVNALIRDVANPSTSDPYFPVSRMFDWFAGHSWAAGLFSSGAGKNEESTSEDYNFAYGMKLWGKMIGDQSMESRGDLMIAVSARAMNSYFLYSSDNTIEPAEIVANKVAGIFYEEKIAYTTFFGTSPEFIHGIQMLPITPISSVIRNPTFTEQEWNAYFSSMDLSSVAQGWLSILMLNRALFDPATSYEFYSQESWNNYWLDNGQSRTWGLTFSAALANQVNLSP